MWTRIIQVFTPNVVRYAALPLATVLGTIGFFIEKKISKPKKIEILETSLIEQRNARISKTLLEEDNNIQNNDGKGKKIIPNTLSVNS